MSDESHFRKLENMYLSAPINQLYQPRMTIGEGTAEIVIPVKEIHFHAASAVHGAVYFKLMDVSAFSPPIHWWRTSSC
jgi:acyl-coenzyme A thioesterase PaaI-like protein